MTPITDYTAVMACSTDERPVVVVPAPTRDSGTDGATTPPETVDITSIVRQTKAEELQFSPDTTNVVAARRLLAETAYERESVLVYQTRIGECFRLRLNQVSRDADGDPNLDFCEVIRDAHTACEREARTYVAAVVRLPFPGTEYNGFSVGGGGRCGPKPDASATRSDSS